MSDNTDIRMMLEAFDAIDAVVVNEGWGASGQQRMKDEMAAEKEKYLEKIKKEKPEAVSNYNMWCLNGTRGSSAYERAMQGKIHPQEKKRLSAANPTEGKDMKKTKKVAEASEAQKAARANFKDMINKKKTNKKDDKKDEVDEKKDKVDDKKDNKKDEDKVDESAAMSFKQLIKLVQESGGQQRIDPIDEALFTWAQRVAASKFDESTKQEVYAGLVYERMGGVFKLHDILSENNNTIDQKRVD